MKKVRSIGFAVMVMVVLITGHLVHAAVETSMPKYSLNAIYLDGILAEPHDGIGPMVTECGYAIVPLRTIIEIVGGEVFWSNYAQIRIEIPEVPSSLVTLGNQEFWAQGRPRLTHIQPHLYRNRTMVSIWTARRILEDHVEVYFDYQINTVIMNRLTT